MPPCIRLKSLIRTRAVDTAKTWPMVSPGPPEHGVQLFLGYRRGEVGLDIAKMKNILGMMGKGDALTLNLRR